MDDGGLIAAIIAGIASLVTIFFGKQYWGSFKALLDGSQKELERLRLQVEAMQVKLDTMETELHKCELARQDALRRLDDYVTANQMLLERNELLATENGELRNRLSVLTN